MMTFSLKSTTDRTGLFLDSTCFDSITEKVFAFSLVGGAWFSLMGLSVNLCICQNFLTILMIPFSGLFSILWCIGSLGSIFLLVSLEFWVCQYFFLVCQKIFTGLKRKTRAAQCTMRPWIPLSELIERFSNLASFANFSFHTNTIHKFAKDVK